MLGRGWDTVETRGAEVVGGVVPTSTMRFVGLEAKWSFRAFTSWSRMGEKGICVL